MNVGSRSGKLIVGLIAAAALGAVLVAPSGASAAGAGCQTFSATPCLLPFPNDLFTKKDKHSATGRRVDLPADAMPVNTEGTPISPAEWNRNDGFSPGSMIVVRVPGLDNPQALANTNPAPLADMSQAFRKKAPVVVIDQKTGKRQLIWVEIDSNAGSPETTNLLIHPGKNFKEGHRYVVVLRNLKDASGNVIDAPQWFDDALDEPSQARRYDRIFEAMGKAKLANGKLYAAWNFTVASGKGLSSRLLAIRNDAFAQLGDRNLADRKVKGSAPAFDVTDVDDSPDNPALLREVKGTFSVPCYQSQDGCPPGAGFNYGSSKLYAKPTQTPGNVATAHFECIIPKASQNQAARPSLYGHGLLGSADEVHAGNVEDMATEHDFVFCATDWWGLSEGDIGYDISALQDLNKFPAAVDRMQQGALNMLYLGRLLRLPTGLASDPAFQSGGRSLIDTSQLYYDSNSQGGIMGGMTTAVAPDYYRGVLGVTGMDYGGILLTRSSDFDLYATFLYGIAPGGGYTDESLHPLILDLAQQLWDRGEADGYAQHMTSHPLPNTPKHRVLMQVAYGDHQVSQYAAAAEARTIGARAYKPPLDQPTRSQDVNLYYKIPAFPKFPFKGSGIVIWDDGPGLVDPPPLTNTSPTTGEDPHEDVRRTVAARQQKSRFLSAPGRIVDVCNALPCHTDAFTP